MLPACGAPSAPTSHGKDRPYDGDNNGDNIHHNNSDNNSDDNGDTREPAALAQPQVRPLFAPGEYSDFPLTPGLPTLDIEVGEVRARLIDGGKPGAAALAPISGPSRCSAPGFGAAPPGAPHLARRAWARRVWARRAQQLSRYA